MKRVFFILMCCFTLKAIGQDSTSTKLKSARPFYIQFVKEKSFPKRMEILDSVILASRLEDADKKDFEKLTNALVWALSDSIIENRDWTKFKKYTDAVSKEMAKYRIYDKAARTLLRKQADLPFAAELEKEAVEWARQQLKDSAALKSPAKKAEARETYISNAFTYAGILYELKKYKEAYPFVKDAVELMKGEVPEMNELYSLVAQKVIPANEYKPQLELFVKNDAAGDETKAALKKAYSAKNKTGFDAYYKSLEDEAQQYKEEKLAKSMLNSPAPQFTLLGTKGEKVSLESLKGKIVILDFWATWCKPCLASFPAMQTMVNKYKTNPEVQFLFINASESGDEKMKRITNFMEETDYTFTVLLDEDNKVKDSFGITAFPKKVIIGKDGNIKFISTGFDGAENLERELSSMIGLLN